MKIYRKNATKVMLIILLGLILAAGLIIKLNQPAPKDNTQWKQSLVQQNKVYQQQMTQFHGNKQTINYFKKTIIMNQYRIDHNLKPAQEATLWKFVEDTASNMVTVISIFTIIVVSSSIASEYDEGTIKLLLIRPIYRTEVLLSKYISTLLFSAFCLIVLFVISWLIGGVMFGFGGVNEAHLNYVNGKVYETSWTLYIWKSYLLNCVSLFVMVTFAGTVSAVFRNSALAIGISILLMMGSSLIVKLLSNFDWVKYVLFANTDLTQYMNGNPVRHDMTLGFSFAVLCIYYLIFVILGWFFYTKRDINA